MTEEERQKKIIERRNKRRDHDEESLKLDRDVTERGNEWSAERFEEMIDNMSPEQASSIMETLGE